jgi:hypothetical protein
MDILTTIALIIIIFEVIVAFFAWKRMKSEPKFFEEDPSTASSIKVDHDAVVFINVEEHHGHFYAWLIDADHRETFVCQAPSYDQLKDEATNRLRHKSLTLKLVFRQP